MELEVGVGQTNLRIWPRSKDYVTPDQSRSVVLWLNPKEISIEQSDLMHWEQPTELKHITWWWKCKQLRLLQ